MIVLESQKICFLEIHFINVEIIFSPCDKMLKILAAKNKDG